MSIANKFKAAREDVRGLKKFLSDLNKASTDLAKKTGTGKIASAITTVRALKAFRDGLGSAF